MLKPDNAVEETVMSTLRTTRGATGWRAQEGSIRTWEILTTGDGNPSYHGWNIVVVRKSEMLIVVLMDKTT